MVYPESFLPPSLPPSQGYNEYLNKAYCQLTEWQKDGGKLEEGQANVSTEDPNASLDVSQELPLSTAPLQPPPPPLNPQYSPHMYVFGHGPTTPLGHSMTTPLPAGASPYQRPVNPHLLATPDQSMMSSTFPTPTVGAPFPPTDWRPPSRPSNPYSLFGSMGPSNIGGPEGSGPVPSDVIGRRDQSTQSTGMCIIHRAG